MPAERHMLQNDNFLQTDSANNIQTSQQCFHRIVEYGYKGKITIRGNNNTQQI